MARDVPMWRIIAGLAIMAAATVLWFKTHNIVIFSLATAAACGAWGLRFWPVFVLLAMFPLLPVLASITIPVAVWAVPPALLVAWLRHLAAVRRRGVSMYPAPWTTWLPWGWLLFDYCDYYILRAPRFAWAAVSAAFRAVRSRDPVLAAVREAVRRAHAEYHRLLAARAEGRYRGAAVLRGKAALEAFLAAKGALYAIDRVHVTRRERRQVRGRDGQTHTIEVDVPAVEQRRRDLMGVCAEVVEDAPDRYVLRFTPYYFHPDDRCFRAWAAACEHAARILGVPAHQVEVEPGTEAIVWTVIGSPEPEELPAAGPPEPALPEPEVWSLAGGDTDTPVAPDGPPLSLLAPPQARRGRPQEGRTIAAEVLRALARAGAEGASIRRVQVGPTMVAVTVAPPSGGRVAALAKAAQELAAGELGVDGVTFRPAGGGQPGVQILVPRSHQDPVPLRLVAACEEFRRAAASPHALAMALGVSSEGAPLILDLAQAPHALVAGTTGSGKSVCLNAALVSLLIRHAPDALRLLICDPKMVEFTPYSTAPHLLAPVLTEPAQMQAAVRWLVAEMDRRYAVLAKHGVKDLAELPKKGGPALPRIVLVVDELADLLMSGEKEERKDTESGLIRLAQKARAAGIHLVLATQKPTVDIVPTLLKANCPTRIACRVLTQAESSVILDQPGAEALRGKGDMLVLAKDGTITRAQGAWLGADEVERVVQWWAERVPQSFDPDLCAALGVAPAAGGGVSGTVGDKHMDDDWE